MTTQDKVIKTKLGLLKLANELNNVSMEGRTGRKKKVNSSWLLQNKKSR